MRIYYKYIILAAVFLLFVQFNSDSGKPIKLIVFEGSDWCANCRRLEKNVLTDSSFVIFLQQNHIELERIDFPQRKKIAETLQTYNNDIAEKYAFDGRFPAVVLTRTDTLVYHRIEYRNQTADEFMKLLLFEIKVLQ